MSKELLTLIIEAMVVYFLVLWCHSLRGRVGLAHFYAFIGGLTAVMSWVTDADVRVEVAGISFMVGSTVFYTSLLLGAFVAYVFDGPRATRIVISTIAGVSIMVPLIALVLHFQMRITGMDPLGFVPIPDFRINAASVLTTIADLVFLAIAWEFLGKSKLGLSLKFRTFITLLGVMWLDVLLFSTGAFFGRADYWQILQGTLISRLFITLFAYPFLYLYLNWQNEKVGLTIENRPLLAILKEFGEVRMELTHAQSEIERRKRVEQENDKLIGELRQALSEVKTLQGLLPTCAKCKMIRDSDGNWQPMEHYIQHRSEVTFSHSVCPHCMEELYPDLKE